MVKPIPEGYHSVTPYLAVRNTTEAIDWYSRALGATELFRFEDGGKVVHAEIKIGDSVIMLSDEWAEGGHIAPKDNGSAVSLMLYVEDVDSAFRRAIESGATEQRAVQDQFYGDRSGSLRDPFGHRWHLATHIEDVEPEEMKRRMDEFGKSQKQSEPA